MIEISVNGGAFNQITPDGGYSHTLYSSSSVPWGTGTPCWSGTFDWTEVVVDLDAYSSQNVQLRFRFGSDSSVSYEGWYIDDVVIMAPNCDPVVVGTLDGTVTGGGLPIPGVLVTADDGGGNIGSDLTAGNGTYSMNLPPSTYTVTATHASYQTEIIYSVVILESTTTTQDIVMDPLPTPDIDVSPTSIIGQAIPGGSDSEILTVSNVGDATLTFSTSVSINPIAPALSIPIVVDDPSYSKLYKQSPEIDKNKPPYSGPENKPDPNIILQGGDLISSATVIGSLPHNSTGTTVGYSDDYDEACTWSSTSPDVVYSYAPSTDMIIDVTLCNGSDYDTKLFIYENNESTLVDCDDDTCPGYVSELLGVGITAGNTYYIVIDGWSGASGNYVLDIDQLPPPDCDDPDTQYGQAAHAPSDGWTAGTSDSGPTEGYLRYDSYSGVSGPIEGITFWGLDLYHDGISWSECSENPMPFTITFYQDAGGQPGTAVQTYTNISITGSPTGLFYSGYELNEYSTTLSPAAVLSSGWLSIQGDQLPPTEIYDLSFCLVGSGVPVWLSVDVDNGSIPSGNPSIPINVLMDATNLTEGIYSGDVYINSNDPDESLVTVPVTFNVGSSPAGHINGIVTGPSGAIENVHVTATGTSTEDHTDISGIYALYDLTPGTYDVTFAHADYRDSTVTGVGVTSGNTTYLNVILEELSGTISGTVTNGLAEPIEGVLVDATIVTATAGFNDDKPKADVEDKAPNMTILESVYTDEFGIYMLEIPAGTYDVAFTHIDYTDVVYNDVAVGPGDNIILSPTMTAGNQRPMILSPATADATEDVVFNYLAVAMDPDGPSPAISFEDYAFWMTPSGDEISGTPLEGYVDTSFTVIASDGDLADTIGVVVTVIPVNDRPTITSPATAVATVDVMFSYIATADDPDGTPAISFEDIASWMGISGDEILGVPPSGSPDTSFTVIASDSELADTVEVSVTVVEAGDCAYVPGDVNGDGSATLLDITPLSNYTVPGLGGDPPAYYCDCGNGLFYPAADVNGDCSVTLLDVTPLAFYTVPGLGGPPPEPCPECMPSPVILNIIKSDQVEK